MGLKIKEPVSGLGLRITQVLGILNPKPRPLGNGIVLFVSGEAGCSTWNPRSCGLNP